MRVFTDRRTDGQTDGRTDRILIAIPRLHYMQRGKNMASSYFTESLRLRVMRLQSNWCLLWQKRRAYSRLRVYYLRGFLQVAGWQLILYTSFSLYCWKIRIQSGPQIEFDLFQNSFLNRCFLNLFLSVVNSVMCYCCYFSFISYSVVCFCIFCICVYST